MCIFSMPLLSIWQVKEVLSSVLKTKYIFHHFTNNPVNDIYKEIKGDISHSAIFVLLFKESEFLKSALSLPWTLSTSQQPQQQMSGQHFSVNEPELAHLVRFFC